MKLLDKIFIRDKKINEYNLRVDREVTMCINDVTEFFMDRDPFKDGKSDTIVTTLSKNIIDIININIKIINDLKFEPPSFIHIEHRFIDLFIIDEYIIDEPYSFFLLFINEINALWFLYINKIVVSKLFRLYIINMLSICIELSLAY